MQFSQLYTQAGNTALVNDSVLAKQAVNDAIRELIAECGLNFTESGLINLTANVGKYSLTTLLTVPPLKIWYVIYLPAGSTSTSALDMMTPASMQEVIELQLNSSSSSGASTYYAIGDFDAFYIYPQAAAGDQVRFYYTSDFTDITVDATVTALIPPHLHYCIVWVAARNLAIVNNAQMVSELEPLAQAAIAKVQEYANRRRGTRPQKARVGYPRNRIISNRSQYWTGMDW
jgi:hypothetical protein